MAPDDLATHLKTKVCLDTYDQMRWEITNDIVLTTSHWDDEMYDEDIDAIGRAKGKGRKGDGKGEEKERKR